MSIHALHVLPSEFLSTATVSLEMLLTQDFYAIPAYQRDYSWRRDNIISLWEDVASLNDRAWLPSGDALPAPRPHFFGPVVLEKTDAAAASVIDGQQRLVTFTGLASVLHEFAQEIDDATRRDSWTATLRNMLSIAQGGQQRPRLTLSRQDKEYRALVVERLSKADRDAYIAGITVVKNSVVERLAHLVAILHEAVEAYVVSTSQRTGWSRSDTIERLCKVLTTLPLQLRMDVKQAGVAYEVFESLNAKGLDLTQADLIKNRLFATAKVQGTESVVEAYWTQTVQALESQTDPWVTLPEFLQFSFASTHDAVKATELFASVSDLLAKKAVTALDYAKAVAAEAQALATMLENGSTFAPDVGRALESLRTHIANKVAFHLLLAASRRHHLASGEFGEVALLTQAYVFRRFVVEGLSLGRFTAEMSEAARMYSQSAMDPAQLAALLQQKSSDAAFVLMFATWTAGTGKQGFYALEMIENHRAAGSGVKLERQSANQHLEHIMPKRPSQGWEHLAAPPEYARTTEYDLFLQRLGNLLVLEADINVVVSNKSFDKKLSGLPKNYCTSKMRLPQDVASHLDQGLWTFRSIERRQKHLADTWAVKVWPLATASPAGSVVGATVS